MNFKGPGPHFGGLLASFWGPGGYLGTLWWPRWLRDRFFLNFEVPWGTHFGDIFRVLGPLEALLEALGPVLEPFWANVVIFTNFFSDFHVFPEAWDLKKV